jgi:hypothetical protein
MNKRKQCQAHIESTNLRCSKSAIRGTKYCWWHQPKGLVILSLVAGAILSLFVSEIWRYFVPTNEQKEIQHLKSQISVLQQEIQRKPEFQPFINGLAVNEFTDINFPSSLGMRTVKQASIVIHDVNEYKKIGLVIRNIGNRPAEKLVVIVKFPSELSLNMGSAWRPLGFLKRTENGMQPDKTITSYYIESANVIDSGAYFPCDSIVIDANITKPFIVPLGIEVSSLQAEKHRFELVIKFEPGSEKK